MNIYIHFFTFKPPQRAALGRPFWGLVALMRLQKLLVHQQLRCAVAGAGVQGVALTALVHHRTGVGPLAFGQLLFYFEN
jgi:hypothetical protein